MRMLLSAASILFCILPSFPAPNTVAGSMLNRRVYWDVDGIRLDTLNFPASLKTVAGLDIQGAKAPRQACDSAAASAKTFFRLKAPSAVSVAILVDAGYKPLVLTQWVGATETDVKIVARGMEKDYMKRRLVSDMLWETVEKAEVTTPSKTATELSVNLHFTDAGYGTWVARDPVAMDGKQIMGTTGGVVLQYDRGQLNEDITIRRQVRAVYIIADGAPKAVISAIEKGMDKLNLDLSYKVPELVRVACGKDGRQ